MPTFKFEPGAIVPAELSRNLNITPESAVITGDAAGRRPLILLVSKDSFSIFTAFSDFDQHVSLHKLSFRMNSIVVSHLLKNALCPTPLSVLENVYVLTLGDTITIANQGDLRAAVRCTYEFPFFSALSRGDSVPSTRNLLDALIASVQRSTEGNDVSCVMLSSGKDSTSLIIALAELGRQRAPCLTYVAGTKNDEDSYSGRFARKLGMRHEVFRLPEDRNLVRSVLTRFFTESPFPTLDPTQVAYLLTLHLAGVSGGLVMDGSGNDAYAGHVPSRLDRWKRLANLSHLGGSVLEKRFPHTSPITFSLKTKSEACFPGFYLSPRLVDAFAGTTHSKNVKQYWLQSDYDTRGLDVFDFRTSVRGRHYELNQVILKAHSAAHAHGAAIAAPWTDSDLADYYFNLPETFRFDRARYVNKILIRLLLREVIGYPDAEIGKRFFEFQLDKFIVHNRQFVAEEIALCDLWTKRTHPYIGRWLDKCVDYPRYAFALHALFMISGWHNHSKILRAGR
jgi:asparagine synthetase B (glutamine-hydrolysing)